MVIVIGLLLVTSVLSTGALTIAKKKSDGGGGSSSDSGSSSSSDSGSSGSSSGSSDSGGSSGGGSSSSGGDTDKGSSGSNPAEDNADKQATPNNPDPDHDNDNDLKGPPSPGTGGTGIHPPNPIVPGSPPSFIFDHHNPPKPCFGPHCPHPQPPHDHNPCGPGFSFNHGKCEKRITITVHYTGSSGSSGSSYGMSDSCYNEIKLAWIGKIQRGQNSEVDSIIDKCMGL